MTGSDRRPVTRTDGKQLKIPLESDEQAEDGKIQLSEQVRTRTRWLSGEEVTFSEVIDGKEDGNFIVS